MRLSELFGRSHIAHADGRFTGQGLEVVEVRYVREGDHGNVDLRRIVAGSGASDLHRVLGREPQIRQVGDDAQGGNAERLVAQVLEPGTQQGRIAAELVDDETLDLLALVRFEQEHGPGQGSEDATAIDVADEQAGRLGVACHAQVDDIGFLEVDLRRTAGALEHDDVVAGRQPIVGGAHLIPPPSPVTPALLLMFCALNGATA